jgi:hypothetical protein
MGKQTKKQKQKLKAQRQQEKEDEMHGAALEAQCERLRKMKLSREACGTEGQEHENDDLARAEKCGFRPCDVREELLRDAVAGTGAEGVRESAEEQLHEYFDALGLVCATGLDFTKPRSVTSDGARGAGGRVQAVPEPGTDEHFAAMHAPLEAAEVKRQATETLHRDNGSKRRGQKAARALAEGGKFIGGGGRRDMSSSAAGSVFDALGVETSESSDDESSGSNLEHGIAAIPTDSGDESDGDTELIAIEGGEKVRVDGELFDAIFAIREAQSYLRPKKVVAKLKQQGFGPNDETGDLKKIIEAVWAV